MRTIILAFACGLFIASSFAQDTASKKTGSQNVTRINVPDFADPEVKKLYTAYAEHLVKCIEAIRNKDEAKVTALFKDPGEKLVSQEKMMVKELVKNPVEKQKYIQFAEQAYPYMEEVEGSAYYQKLYGGK